MRQAQILSATREVLSERPKKIHKHQLVNAVRTSLVNVNGLTYPNLQPSLSWNEFIDNEDGSVAFEFLDRRPRGELRVYPDGSVTSRREPLDEEVPPAIYLEALTYEVAYFAEFVSRLNGPGPNKLGSPGVFRLALLLEGFNGAWVDWQGFSEVKTADTSHMLINWRFRPPAEAPTFECEGVSFPSTSGGASGVADIIAELSLQIRGQRRRVTLDHVDTNSRLELDKKSIQRVVASARKNLDDAGGVDVMFLHSREAYNRLARFTMRDGREILGIICALSYEHPTEERLILPKNAHKFLAAKTDTERRALSEPAPLKDIVDARPASKS